MKKMFGVIIAVIGICEVGVAMNRISYHSLISDEKKEDFIQCPYCSNSADLERQMADKTWTFVDAPSFEKNGIAERLLVEYKQIFCIDDGKSLDLKYMESGAIESFEDLSEEDLNETADSIAELCDGLPAAATKIQNMSEVIGDYRRALIWALVAYKFGELGAEEAIGRLLVGMEK